MHHNGEHLFVGVALGATMAGGVPGSPLLINFQVKTRCLIGSMLTECNFGKSKPFGVLSLLMFEPGGVV